MIKFDKLSKLDELEAAEIERLAWACHYCGPVECSHPDEHRTRPVLPKVLGDALPELIKLAREAGTLVCVYADSLGECGECPPCRCLGILYRLEHPSSV